MLTFDCLKHFFFYIPFNKFMFFPTIVVKIGWISRFDRLNHEPACHPIQITLIIVVLINRQNQLKIDKTGDLLG